MSSRPISTLRCYNLVGPTQAQYRDKIAMCDGVNPYQLPGAMEPTARCHAGNVINCQTVMFVMLFACCLPVTPADMNIV